MLVDAFLGEVAYEFARGVEAAEVTFRSVAVS
jgi:hypothetical protein